MNDLFNTPLVAEQSLRVWLKMLKTTRLIEARLRKKLRVEFGATLPRFDVMAALYRFEGGLNMSQLSSALRVSNGNVTGIVERLVNDGAVRRVAVAGDKRATLAVLTASGRAQFAVMAAAHRDWIADMLQRVSAEAGSQIAAVMDRIAATPAAAKEGH